MNRRSFFRVLPVAASPVALAAAGVAYAAENKSTPPATAGITFSHGTPVPPDPNSNAISFNVYENVKNHGTVVMHEGELWIRAHNKDWRKIS